MGKTPHATHGEPHSGEMVLKKRALVVPGRNCVNNNNIMYSSVHRECHILFRNVLHTIRIDLTAKPDPLQTTKVYTNYGFGSKVYNKL